MQKIFSLILIAFIEINICFAQSKPFEQTNSNGISNPTAVFLMKMQQIQRSNNPISNLDTALFANYDMRKFNQEWYVGSFIVVNSLFNQQEAEKLGVKINTHRGNILTGYIPIDKIRLLQKIKGVKYIELGTKAHPNLDNSRAEVKAGMIHNGYNLPQAFKGEGVITGAIDIGMDFTCPNFFKAGTNNTRIKKVWDQNSDNGTNPSGFNYGRELTSQNDIFSAQTDNSNQVHASHVMGIEAGCGGYDTTYKGMAPEGDIYFVGTTMYTNSIADGIDYLFTQAQQVGKPCVVNMSIGGNTGPRDGSSVFDQYCDNEVGQGKILVGAAGNSGGDALHIGKTFNSLDSISSFCRFHEATNSTANNGKTEIDIWGDSTASNIDAEICLYNSQTNQIVDYTSYISSSNNNSYSYHLINSNSDTCYVYISGNISTLNNKHNIYIYVDNRNNTNSDEYIMLKVKSSHNHINIWGYNEDFVSLEKSFATNGDTTMTVSEIGGTGNSIITVGSYISKFNFTSFQGNNYQYMSGELNNISPFSSVGPTADGRTKPDITAPGQGIVSTINSFNSNYDISSSIVVDTIYSPSKTWLFAVLQGTSMAAPAVSGVVALLLQKYPKLTPSQVKSLLTSNATQDSFTGIIPFNGSNTWGWGKTNAYSAMTDLISKVPQKPSITPNTNVALCKGDSIYAPLSYSHYLWNNGDTTRAIAPTVSGYYTVMVTNGYGYQSEVSDSVFVTVYPNYDTVINSSICYGGVYDLDGFHADTSGTYVQHLQTIHGCDSTITLNLTVICSLTDTQEQNIFTLYPNPTTDNITITFSSLPKDNEIRLYNIQGSLIKEYSLDKSSKTFVIDCKRLKKGVYFLKIDTFIRKLIVQ